VRPPIVAKENNNFGVTSPSYPKITWTICLYREPEYELFSSLMPMLVLLIVFMGIFLLDHSDTADRLALIITVLLAFFAFLPSYRSQMPSRPQMTMMDWNIVFSVIVILCGFIDTVVGSYLGEVVGVKIAMFVTALIFVFAIPVKAALSYIHHCKYYSKMTHEQKQPEPDPYHIMQKNSEETKATISKPSPNSKKSSERLDLKQWSNEDLEECFQGDEHNLAPLGEHDHDPHGSGQGSLPAQPKPKTPRNSHPSSSSKTPPHSVNSIIISTGENITSE